MHTDTYEWRKKRRKTNLLMGLGWTCCRACSTAECTATNIIQAPIAHAPRAPRSSRLCSLLLLPLLLLPAPAPFAPAPCSCSSCSCSCSSCSCSCSLCLCLCSLLFAHAPFACSSLLGFGAALGHCQAPRVCTIPYLGFASQHLA